MERPSKNHWGVLVCSAKFGVIYLQPQIVTLNDAVRVALHTMDMCCSVVSTFLVQLT